MYDEMKQVDLEVEPRVEGEIVRVEPKRRNYNVKGRGARGAIGVLAQGLILSVLLLAFFAFRSVDSDFTNQVLDAVSRVVANGESRTETGGIRFVGGVFTERKLVLAPPYTKFSFENTGANLKLVGVSASVKPCAAGTVTEIGSSGDSNYVEISHGNDVAVRYFTLSEVLVKVGDVVDSGSVLAIKAAYDPVVLNVYYDGKLLESLAVNRDMEIECKL